MAILSYLMSYSLTSAVSKLLRAKLESIKDSGAESLGLFDSSVQNDCLDTIQVMLETNIVFPQRSSFATIRSFWDSFQAKGGIIEAMPYSEDTPNLFELSRAHETVVFMNLSPGGEIAIYGAVDKV